MRRPASADFFKMPGTLVLRDPVSGGGVLRRQYPLAGLQTDAMAAFEAFEDAFGFLLALGNDFWKLFEQRFRHNRLFNDK